MVNIDVIVVWLFLPTLKHLGYINIYIPYIRSSPLLKVCIFVMYWQWCYHLTPIFAIINSIVSTYVPQSTRIVHIIDSNCFSQCTTADYSILSKENGNCFSRQNITSTKNSFLWFRYIITQHLLGLWFICCNLDNCALNEIQDLVIYNSNKA